MAQPTDAPHRSTLTPGLVLQRGRHDCGVACLAMAAGVDHATAERAFIEVGLGAKRGGKPAFASNFKDLRAALRHLGHDSRLVRFTDWSHLRTPAIIKVQQHPGSGGKKGDWHWVFSSRHPIHGLVVLDPSLDVPAVEIFPPVDAAQPFNALGVAGLMAHDLSFHRPQGCFIEVLSKVHFPH